MQVALNRLKKRADFIHIGQSTLKYQSSFFIIKTAFYSTYSTQNELSAYFGYTVTKKIGSAVVRNKIKRQLRVLSQNLKDDFAIHYGYVMIIRPDFLKLNFDQMQQHFKKALLYLKTKIPQ